ncbi:hypothetical protein VTL71DRAFT_7733 [Oculimacula yallundae]|uniref:Uncharacterized protein n=1 Tax=Oculimacula yallundae TaxID=86028 RepID=A0ABR4CVI4_9HELO
MYLWLFPSISSSFTNYDSQIYSTTQPQLCAKMTSEVIPPLMELQAKTPQDRAKLLAQLKKDCDKKTRRPLRILGTYINTLLLNKKGKAQLPYEWADYHGSPPLYQPLERLFKDLSINPSKSKKSSRKSKVPAQMTNTTFLKRLAHIHLYCHGGMTHNQALEMLEKRHQGGDEPARKGKIIKLKEEVTFIHSKILTEVGVFIMMSCLCEHQWLTAAFETRKERVDYFIAVLAQNPFLIVLFTHRFMGSVYNIGWVYTTFVYQRADAPLNDLKEAHQGMNGITPTKAPLTTGFRWAQRGLSKSWTRCQPDTVKNAHAWFFFVPYDDSWLVLLGRHSFEVRGLGDTLDHYRRGGAGDPVEICVLPLSETDLAGLVVRNGHGAAQDFLHIFKFSKETRNTRLPAQFIRVNAGKEEQYYVSVSIPSIESLGKHSNTCITVGDEISIYFRHSMAINPNTKKRDTRMDAWHGFVCERGELPNHSGSHLLRVSRPFFGAVGDPTRVFATDAPDKNATYVGVFVSLDQDVKTVKARINTFRKMDSRITATAAGRKSLGLDEAETIITHTDRTINPDDEDEDQPTHDPIVADVPVNSKLQKDICIRRELKTLWYVDLFAGLDEVGIARAIDGYTELQKTELLVVARSVPLGILPILGPKGTGKTTVVVRMLVAACM